MKKQGLTLIEALITIGVFALTMGAVVSMILTLYRTQNYTWEQAVAVNEAKKGVETMVREIREAKEAGDGSYLIEKADDKEFVFYSDIDDDGKIERVRYFLGTINSGIQVKECQTFVKGGSCVVNFSNFLLGTLVSASVKVSVVGDFGMSNEYAEIYADGGKMGNICVSGCLDCPSVWQGTVVFDVMDEATNNSVDFLVDASSYVDPSCPHSMKARFEFSYVEDLSAFVHEFKKGVIKPVGDPPVYSASEEIVTILTPYVRNFPPIFEYFDSVGNKILEQPARLVDTKLMKFLLVVNVDPNRAPSDFQLESFVQLRNLKTE